MEHNELAGHARLFTYRFRGIGLQAAEIPNLVFAGTSVAQGSGRAVVIHTGRITKFDKIARLTQNVEDNVSPLQREFNHLPRQITIFALCIGVVFFILDVLFVHNPLAETFIFSLGMVVAFILEGLLPTVTRALAMAVQRMSKRNALVKKLSSVESLGSTSVICTDKTGTLTRNEMTVEYLWILNHEYQVSRTGYAPKGEITVDGAVHHAADDAVLRELVTGGALCSNAHLHESKPDHDVRDDHMPSANGRWQVYGDPTEIVLLVLITEVPILQTVFHTAPLSWGEYLYLCCIPFVILAIEELRKFIWRHRFPTGLV